MTHIRHMYKLVAVSSWPNSRLFTKLTIRYGIGRWRAGPRGRKRRPLSVTRSSVSTVASTSSPPSRPASALYPRYSKEDIKCRRCLRWNFFCNDYIFSMTNDIHTIYILRCMFFSGMCHSATLHIILCIRRHVSIFLLFFHRTVFLKYTFIRELRITLSSLMRPVYAEQTSKCTFR
jgi:hypothetical protein